MTTRFSLAVTLGGALAAVAPTAAQTLLRVPPGAGEVGFGAEAASGRLDARRRAEDSRHREWLKLSLGGSLFDARRFAWSATLRPTWSQGATGEPAVRLATRSLALDASARAAPFGPLALEASASRSHGTSDRGPGAFGDFRSGSAGGSATLRTVPLAVSLRVARREYEHRTVASALSPELLLRHAHRTLRLEAENRKLRAYLERTGHEDADGRRTASESSGLDHTLRWGRGSSLRSSLQRSRRPDASLPLAQSGWAEELRLRHSPRWVTRLGTSVHTSRAGDDRTRSRASDLDLEHRPSAWLNAGLHAGWRGSEATERRTRAWEAGPRAGAEVRLPLDARGSASGRLAWGEERRDGRLDARVPVLDEVHAVPPGRSFTLGEPGADPATIEVREADGALRYVEGVDYLVQPLGAAIEIVIPVGSRIEPGDVLEVSYVVVLAAGPRARTFVAEHSLSLRWRGLALHHADTRRAAQAGGERGPAIAPAYDESSLRIEAAGAGRPGSARAAWSRRHRASASFHQVTEELSGHLLPRAWRGARPALDGSLAWSRGEGRAVRTRALGLRVHWPLAPGVGLDTDLQGSAVRSDGFPEERLLAAGSGLSLRHGALEAHLTTRTQWRRGPSDGRFDRWTARVVRRF